MSRRSVCILLKAGAAAGAVATALSAYHVHVALKQHEQDIEDAMAAMQGTEFEQKIASLLAVPGDEEAECVSEEAFLECLAEAERSSAPESIVPFDSVYVRVMREPVTFVAAGRAVALQLAHPFISTAILHHSYLGAGIQARFYNTFYYMFRIGFGTRAEALKAARTVRRMHGRIHGSLEATGCFPAGSRYTAHNISALAWVQATLVESSVFMYQMFYRRLTTSELNSVLESSQRIAMLFGLRPNLTVYKTWQQFLAYCGYMHRNAVLHGNEPGKKLLTFLFEPPALMFAPFMRLLITGTGVQLPKRLATEFGIFPNRIAYLVYILVLGFVRLMFRMMPASFRLLTPYIRAVQRQNPQAFKSFLSRWSAAMANGLLAMAMPPRTPTGIPVAREVQHPSDEHEHEVGGCPFGGRKATPSNPQTI